MRMEKKRKRQIRNINSELPSSVIEVILSKLPFFNLPSCRLVCKEWNNLVLNCKFDPISNFFFAHIAPYRNLHCVDFDPKHFRTLASFKFHRNLSSRTRRISIVNSCNGLLCLLIMQSKRKRAKPHDVCILNPMTNEFINLPISKADRKIKYFYGLGFSPKTKQYKIARHSFIRDKSANLVEIFAFGTSREWTPVGFMPFSIDYNCNYHGVYFNGGLYFVGELEDENVIYRLDIEDEKIKAISSPPDYGDLYFLGVFNGALYLTVSMGDEMEEEEHHVWKMEEDFSWIEVFAAIRPEDLYLMNDVWPSRIFNFQLIKDCEDGKILCLSDGLDLLLYDPNSEEPKILTNVNIEIKKHMLVHQIDSFNFNSLHKILVGND